MAKHPQLFIAIFDYLSEQKLINPNIATTWKYFIQICLEKDDFEGAVNTFEKIAVEKKGNTHPSERSVGNW